MHSPFSPSWLRRPRRTGYGSSSDSCALFQVTFVLAVQIARAWFQQQIHKAFHYVYLPSRPQNPNNKTPKKDCFHSKYYPPFFFQLMYTRVTYEVTWSKSKRLRRMTHEAALRTVFPAKKGAKRHTKHLVSVSMCYSRHLDGIPKKLHFSRQLPLICMQRFQHAHWLRRRQLIPNCVESWNWMQKVEWIAESWN